MAGKTQIGTRAITKKMFGTREITKEVVNGVVVYEKASGPSKGDIINIDMTGSGTSEQYRVIKVLENNVVEVIKLTITAATTNSAGYNGSSADTMLQTTLYNTFSETAKAAIVDKTFKSNTWEIDSTYRQGWYVMVGQSNNSYIRYSSDSGNEMTRHCYVLNPQDIIDYLEVTTEMTSENTTFTYTNLFTMLYNTTTPSPNATWLCGRNTSAYPLAIGTSEGYIRWLGTNNNCPLVPAMQIDLSKIDFTIQT